MSSLDLNLDAAEDPAALADGREAARYRWVTRVNIACGGHAGDDDSMALALKLARGAGVVIGAHPSYPDREHFGRRSLSLTATEIADTVRAQVTRLSNIARAHGVELDHVKPHGALYHDVSARSDLARAFAEAVATVSRRLKLVAAAGAPALELWRKAGHEVLAEGFADRLYAADGALVARDRDGAVLTHPQAAARQAADLWFFHEVTTAGGTSLHMKCQTLCVHGDNPNVDAVLPAVRAALEGRGFPEHA